MKCDENQIALFLMNQKGFYVLQEIVAHGFLSNVAYVVTGRDKNVTNDFSDQIAALCQQNQIPCFARTASKPKFDGYQIAIGWRWLIKDSQNLIVIHDSLLPKYRGFAPLVSCLINGDSEIGATAIFANDRVDGGSIISQVSLEIEYPIKIAAAIGHMSEIYWQLAKEVITQVRDGKVLKAVPQTDDNASFSVWLDDDDYRIDWNWDANMIQRFVDAKGTPYKGACTSLDKETLRVHDVSVVPDERLVNRHVGKVMRLEDNYPIVICGSGLLRLNHLTDEQGNDALPLKRFRCRFR